MNGELIGSNKHCKHYFSVVIISLDENYNYFLLFQPGIKRHEINGQNFLCPYQGSGAFGCDIQDIDSLNIAWLIWMSSHLNFAVKLTGTASKRPNWHFKNTQTLFCHMWTLQEKLIAERVVLNINVPCWIALFPDSTFQTNAQLKKSTDSSFRQIASVTWRLTTAINKNKIPPFFASSFKPLLNANTPLAFAELGVWSARLAVSSWLSDVTAVLKRASAKVCCLCGCFLGYQGSSRRVWRFPGGWVLIRGIQTPHINNPWRLSSLCTGDFCVSKATLSLVLT